MKYTRAIAIAAQKGGVGKTATAINLGVALSNLGKKVLVIDCDNHPSLSIRLGIQQPDKLESSIVSIMMKAIADEPIDPSEGIHHHEEGIDFIPSNNSLAGIEMVLAGEVGRESFLSNYVETLRGQYDYILLDSLPSIGLIAINVLAAADEVMLITKADFDSAKAMEDLLQSIQKIKKKVNKKLQIAGALITMVDLRTNDAKETIEMLHDAYGADIHFFKSMIPASVRAREAGKYGISIFSHAPNSTVALAYAELAKEVDTQ